MIAPRRFVKSGMATSELFSQNMVGDTIRWHITTESNNFDQSAILYDFKYYPEGIISSLDISTATKDCVQSSQTAESTNKNIPAVIRANCSYTMAEARANTPGRLQYFAHFGIFERSRKTGKYVLVGYFMWDPFLIVA